MELRQLNYFIALAEEKNFSRAANKVFVSQPALSQQIADLEKELGYALVERGHRALSLTKAGEILLEEARAIINEANTIIPKIQAAYSEIAERPELTIALEASDVGLDRYGVINALIALQQRNPNLHLQFKLYPIEKVSHAIKAGDVDIGLYLITDYEKQFQFTNYHCVIHESFCLLVPYSYVLRNPQATWREALREYPIYIRSGDERWRAFFAKTLTQAEPQLQVKYLESLHLINSYVQAGLGISIASEKLANHMKNQYMAALPIDLPGFSAHEVILWNENATNPVIKEFLSMFFRQEE